MIRSGVVSAAHAASSFIESRINRKYRTFTTLHSSQLDPISGCGSCSAAGGCGVQLLPVAPGPLVIDCQLPVDAKVFVGDRVQVQLAEPDGDWLRIVIHAYASPTIGMITGALGGYWSAHALQMPQLSDSLSLVGFVVGLAGGLIAWSRAEKSVQMRYIGEHRLLKHEIIQER